MKLLNTPVLLKELYIKRQVLAELADHALKHHVIKSLKA